MLKMQQMPAFALKEMERSKQSSYSLFEVTIL
jgi:hypothetical protein